MTKARDLAELIGNSLIDGDEIATGAVGTSNLAATLDFSSKTMVMANDQLSGDKIHGGTISNFASTGIDDNSSSTSVTILSNGNVGIGTDTPGESLVVTGDGARITVESEDMEVAMLGRRGSTGAALDDGYLRLRKAGVTADGIVLNTGGLSWLNGGNVGIGTDNPGYKLDVYEASGNGLRIKAGDQIADVALSVGSAGTADKFVIQSGGNVGIGTDVPGALLDVNDDGVTDNAWNTLAKFRPDLADNHAETSIHIQSYPSTTVVADRKAGIQSIDDAGNARSLILNKDGGNIGIGTTDPVSTLDVSTTNSVGSVFRKDFNGPVANNFSKVAVTLWGQDHDDADVGTGTDQYGPMLGFGARIDDGNPNSGDVRAGISYSYNGDLTFHAKAGSSVADGSYERIRIDGVTGNVGIGTDTPNAFLSVRKDNSNSGNQFVIADTEGVTAGVRTYTHNGDDPGLILNHYYAVAGSGNQYMRYADFVANVGNGAGTTMRFITKNSSNTFSTGLQINQDGKVIVNSGYSSGNFGMYIQGKGSGVADARALHVRGFGGHTTIGGTGPTLVLQNADGTTNNITKLSFETASNGEAVSINCFNTDHGNFYGDMAFNTRGSLGYSEKLRIMANGNVGIGTTTPAEKLQVVGNVDVRGALSVSSGGFGSQLYTSANAASNPNGNEANQISGWILGYTGASMSSVGTENGVAPTNGSYQLKYTGTNNGARMDYAFQVVAGKRYEVTLNSDWYQGNLYSLIYIADSNSGDNLGAAISSVEALNGTSYAQKRLTFGATLSGTVYLSLRMASTSSPQNITYIDNISIKEIVGADIFAQDQFLSGRLSVANTIVAPNQIGFRARGNTSQWLNLATPSSGAAWNKITNTIHAGDGTNIGVNLTTATKNNFNCWNTGNDFSLGTGTFTAAVAGIYAISFTMYGQKNSSASASDFCYALPYINGQQINELYAGVGANETPAPGDFMINYSHTVQLEVGDYLSFQVYASSKHVQMYGDHCSCGAELLH